MFVHRLKINVFLFWRSRLRNHQIVDIGITHTRKLRTDVSEVQEHDSNLRKLHLREPTLAPIVRSHRRDDDCPLNYNTPKWKHTRLKHNRNKTPVRTFRDTLGNVPLCISICAVKGESCSEHCIELRVSVSNVNDNRGCVTWILLENTVVSGLAFRDKVWSEGLGGAITANHGLCRMLITSKKRCNLATHLRTCPAVEPLSHLNFASAIADRFSPIYVRCSREIKAW